MWPIDSELSHQGSIPAGLISVLSDKCILFRSSKCDKAIMLMTASSSYKVEDSMSVEDLILSSFKQVGLSQETQKFTPC